jgi:hypothetical protein
MSIKIYNGFRIQGDIFVALGLVKTFRNYIKRESEKKLDFFMKKMEPRARDLWTDWLDERRKVELTGYRNPLVDTDFKLTLFPVRTGVGEDEIETMKDEVYGIAYHDTPAWFAKWLTMPRVSEYGYWNNSDEPDGMSMKQWDARKRLWESLLTGDKKTGVPSMYGLSIDVSDPMGPMPKALRIEAKKERERA